MSETRTGKMKTLSPSVIVVVRTGEREGNGKNVTKVFGFQPLRLRLGISTVSFGRKQVEENESLNVILKTDNFRRFEFFIPFMILLHS